MFIEVGLLDQEFHDLVVETSGSKQLVQLLDVIKVKIIYMRNTMIRHYYTSLHDFIGEHERIYQALQARDEKKAEAEMRSHIQRSIDVFNCKLYTPFFTDVHC